MRSSGFHNNRAGTGRAPGPAQGPAARRTGKPVNFFMDPHTLLAETGDAAKTVMLSQAVPDPHCTDIPLVAEFAQLAASGSRVPCHVQALEGFMQARVVVEGLKRASQLDAAGLLHALEAIDDLDLGGHRLSFSDDSHEGCAAVQMAVVTPSGRLIHHA